MLIALLGFVLLPPADTDPPILAPTGTPPRIVSVSLEGKQLVAKRTVTEYVPQTQEFTVQLNGKTVKQTRTVMVPVSKEVKESWSLEGADIQQIDGKKLDLDTLKKRLSSTSVVVISSDGRPVNAGYLSIFKKDAVVVVPKMVNLVPRPAPLPPNPPRPRIIEKK